MVSVFIQILLSCHMSALFADSAQKQEDISLKNPSIYIYIYISDLIGKITNADILYCFSPSGLFVISLRGS